MNPYQSPQYEPPKSPDAGLNLAVFLVWLATGVLGIVVGVIILWTAWANGTSMSRASFFGAFEIGVGVLMLAHLKNRSRHPVSEKPVNRNASAMIVSGLLLIVMLPIRWLAWLLGIGRG